MNYEHFCNYEDVMIMAEHLWKIKSVEEYAKIANELDKKLLIIPAKDYQRMLAISGIKNRS